MKVLFFTQYNATPHLETELEIGLNLIREGHEVYFLYCHGELQTCYENYTHAADTCRICYSKKLQGLKVLGLPEKNILRFPKNLLNRKEHAHTFNSILELKAFEYDGIDIGMGVASSMISQYREHRLDTAEHSEEINTGIETAIFAYRSFKKIIEEINPEAVYFFNGRFLEIRPLMRICERKNIDFYTHERGGTIHTYLCRKNGTPHSISSTTAEINSLWADGGAEKEAIGAKFYVDRRNRQIQSWHVFTEDQTIGALPENFDKNKRNMVFFNSSMDEYEGIAGFTSKIFPDDHVGLTRILKFYEADPEIHFYLRSHPNLKNLHNTQNTELEEISSTFKNFTLIRPSEFIDSYALMDACEKVLVFNSTIGAEAAFWKKPVILLGNASYGSLNSFYKPVTADEAIELIGADLAPLPSLDTLKYGYYELQKGLPHNFYKPETLTTGIFLGERLKASRKVKVINFLLYYIRRIFREFTDTLKKAKLRLNTISP